MRHEFYLGDWGIGITLCAITDLDRVIVFNINWVGNALLWEIGAFGCIVRVVLAWARMK